MSNSVAVSDQTSAPVDRPQDSLGIGDRAGEGGAKRGSRQGLGLLLGVVGFCIALALPASEGLSPEGQRVGAVTLLMAIWWMTEAIPLAVTALLPIALFPALGVMSTASATTPYADQIIFLFMGGFFIALAMQRWHLHRRIALAVVSAVGTEPRRLVLGFMLATAFLSMWISNTATAVMMLPMGTAVLTVLEQGRLSKLGTPLMLGIAYAASIGGLATLIGTPPNAVFAAAAREFTGRSIGFVEWMYIGVPLATILLVFTWFFLVRIAFKVGGAESFGAGVAEVIRKERMALGPIQRGEQLTAAIFIATAFGWILREPKDLGFTVIPGLATFLPQISDGSIAIAGAIALFVLPVSLRKRTFLLEWKSAAQIPWDVLLLFGGGLSLASAFDRSGLATWIGQLVMPFGSLPPIVMIAIVVILFSFLTELTSNTATATMGMPLMAGIASGLSTDPLVLMASVAMISSLAFMLPVGTPPNAIVFASGEVTISQMMRTGFRINLFAIFLITLVGYFLVGYVLGQ